MRVNWAVNNVFSGWNPDDTRLGGTEDSVVQWARRMALLGVDVHVFSNIKNPGIYFGTHYHNDFGEYEPGVAAINVKRHDFAPVEKNTWYLTNETDASRLDLSKFEGVILPSKWALENLDVVHRKIQILPHGYDHRKVFPGKKIKNQCLYASSPDRGLQELVKFWPEVVKQVPDATLVVTYGGYLELPNTICVGDVDEETMDELFNTSEFWVYPCIGGELYCITGIKAQVAEAIPVYYPTMALSETVEWGIQANPDSFVRKLVKAMKSDGYKREILAHNQKHEYPTWDSTTLHLLMILGIKPWLTEADIIQTIETTSIEVNYAQDQEVGIISGTI